MDAFTRILGPLIRNRVGKLIGMSVPEMQPDRRLWDAEKRIEELQLAVDALQAGIRIRPATFVAAGLVADQRLFIGSLTTNGSGAGSLDISAAGFTLVRAVIPAAFNSGAGITNAPVVSITAVSTTSISVLTMESNTPPTSDGLEISASRTVYLLIIGD